jgi:hypothetical protein
MSDCPSSFDQSALLSGTSLQSVEAAFDQAVADFYTSKVGSKDGRARPYMLPDQIYRELHPDLREMAKAIAFGDIEPAWPEVRRLIQHVDRPQAEPWRANAQDRLNDRLDPEQRRKAFAKIDRRAPNLFFDGDR